MSDKKPSAPLTMAELQAQLAASKARESELEQAVTDLAASNRKSPALTAKVSEKGAVSLYGVRRFPVTFYEAEWEKIFGDGGDLVKACIKENQGKLSQKAPSAKQQIADKVLSNSTPAADLGIE